MNRFVMIRVLFTTAAGALAVVLLAPAQAAAQDSDKLLADVKAAWEKRETATKTIRMAWSIKSINPKGSLNLIMPSDLTTDGKSRPSEDVTHTGKASLLLDGLAARYSEENMMWSEPAFKFVSHRVSAVYREGQTTTLKYLGIQNWPAGTIRKSEWNSVCTTLATWAPCIAVRGTQATVMNGDHLAVFTSARPTTIEGKPAIELRQQRSETRGEIKMWVLINEGYCPIRYEVFNGQGELVQRVIVTNRVVKGDIWLPAGWTASSFRSKRLTREDNITMQSTEIGGLVNEEELTIRFPTGTKVIDMTTDQLNEYIVKDNDQKRQIQPEERTAKYEDLLRTEPGELVNGGKPDRLARYWWLVVVGGLSIALMSVVVWKLSYKKSNRPTQL